MYRQSNLIRCLALVLLTGVVLAGIATAQTSPAGNYRLSAGDQLQLSVPQQPELDRELAINPDGTVLIPNVGPVLITGLTVIEAAELIRQRLRLFNPEITDISLTVTEFNAMEVFVLGAVNTPGTYTFTKPPSLWDAIRAAGGPKDEANLGLVRVVNEREGASRSQVYDLTAFVTGRGTLPAIRLGNGDTVVLPAGTEGVIPFPSEAGVQVFGSVNNPGTIPLKAPTRLLTLLMLAGSPKDESHLGRIWWVHREGPEEFRATEVNLKLYLEKGSLAGNPLVYPGDTVRVPRHSPGWFGTFFPVFVSTVTATAAVLLAIDRIGN